MVIKKGAKGEKWGWLEGLASRCTPLFTSDSDFERRVDNLNGGERFARFLPSGRLVVDLIKEGLGDVNFTNTQADIVWIILLLWRYKITKRPSTSCDLTTLHGY